MFLFIHSLAVEEATYTKHRGLADVAGHVVRGRWAFEERWVQRRGGYTSKLCASFSKHGWAHGNPASSNVGVLKQVWPISPPCATHIFRLFQSDSGFFSADKSCQSEQCFPLSVVQSKFWFLCFYGWMHGRDAWLGCAFLLVKLFLSLLFPGDLFLWDEWFATHGLHNEYCSVVTPGVLVSYLLERRGPIISPQMQVYLFCLCNWGLK